MERTTQATRFRAAVAQLATAWPGLPLPSSKAKAYVRRVMGHQWALRTFTPTSRWETIKYARARPRELAQLAEMAYYLVPSASWARTRRLRESWIRRETAWSLLLLVQHVLGRKAAQQLRAAYAANGVKYRPRRTISAAQKARLTAQLQRTALKENVTITIAPPAPTVRRRRITFTDE